MLFFFICIEIRPKLKCNWNISYRMRKRFWCIRFMILWLVQTLLKNHFFKKLLEYFLIHGFLVCLNIWSTEYCESNFFQTHLELFCIWHYRVETITGVRCANLSTVDNFLSFCLLNYCSTGNNFSSFNVCLRAMIQF